MINNRIICSRSNVQFKLWRSLHDSKGIKKHSRFLFFGERPVSELLAKHPDQIEVVLISEKQEPTRVSTLLKPAKIALLDNSLFEELDLFGTKSPIAVCKTPELAKWDHQKESEGLTLLCPVGDPGNLGNIIRSCAAFNVRKLVLLKEACSPFHPKTVRSTSGTLFEIEMLSGPSIHTLQKDWQENWFALNMHGQPLNGFRWPQNTILLVGEEGPGLPESLSDSIRNKSLKIEMGDNCESLNAAVATSIALYSYKTSKPTQ